MWKILIDVSQSHILRYRSRLTRNRKSSWYYSSRFNAPYGPLNTGQEPITINEIKRVFEEGKEFRAPKTLRFPLDVKGEADNGSLDNPPDTYLDHWWLIPSSMYRLLSPVGLKAGRINPFCNQ